MKKILFIGHDASRTGAPLLLLQIIKWFCSLNKYDVTILLKDGGELYESYNKLAKTYLWNDSEKYPKTVFDRILYHFYTKNYKKRILNKLKSEDYDLIYANTIISLGLLELVSNKTVKTILHVHELDYAIQTSLLPKEFNQYDYLIDKYISVSEAVKQNLVKNHRINANKIETIYAFAVNIKNKIPNVSSELKQNEEEFIIGNVGRVDWLKGVDIFILLAKQLSKYKAIKLVWIGGFSNEIKIQFETELKKHNLTNLSFYGQKEDISSFYKTFSIFFLTSRQDSFPLVVLEAASCGIPVFCFENSGGASEFVENNINGKILPYADIQHAVDEIIKLYNNRIYLKKMGEKAKEKSLNYTIDKTCSKIQKIITQLTSN